jgi:hypothetical protein
VKTIYQRCVARGAGLVVLHEAGGMRPDWMGISTLRVKGQQKYHASLKLYPEFLMHPTTQSPLCLNLDWPDTWLDQNVQRRHELLKSTKAEYRIAFPGLPGLPERHSRVREADEHLRAWAIGTRDLLPRTPGCAMPKSTSESASVFPAVDRSSQY